MLDDIVIIGSGNVAWHLAECIVFAGYNVKQVYGRNTNDKTYFSHLDIGAYISDIKELDPHVDMYLFCVNDDAILEVVDSIPFQLSDNQILVHTSGATPSTILSPYSANFGCLWPLQSLKRETPVVTNEIPFVITASNEYVKLCLLELADQISNDFTWIDDTRKEKLHLAAVLVNNFANHLYRLTYDYCEQEDIKFDLLIPLIKETAEKLTIDIPENNQTGPAIRNDDLTIMRHLTKLEKHPDLYKLYCFFSENIIKKYGRISFIRS
ncbi:MAG: DUF2520 domain-containing protein [Saprospiraceae bacterium]|nr:DUF2520 domain-containing protein [Saprospiraceae bacterium]